MGTRRREKTRRKKRKVASEMSMIEFDLKAINEIKKRKKRMYERVKTTKTEKG